MKKKGKTPLERGRHRWENNIEMVLKQQCEYVERIQMAQEQDPITSCYEHPE
jgi:hypothetical protein